jgi:tRNA-modifying protein YgfZ
MVAARRFMTFQHNTPNPSVFSPRAYAAARAGAAWFARPTEGRLLVGGPDRASWLQGLLTNDVAALGAGRGCYAAHLTPQGRMVSDMRLLETGHEILMDVPESTRQLLLDRFDLFLITEDVRLSDVTQTLARLTVVGPGAAAALEAALPRAGLALAAWGAEGGEPARLDRLGEHTHVRVTGDDAAGPSVLEAGHGLVAATLDAGVSGFDVYLPPGRLAALTGALEGSGAVAGDDAVFELLRIEAGRPRFGADMDTDTIPLEAGLEDRAISFTKGCYVGQEIIVRVRDRGHGRVARRLVGLRVEAPEALEAGDVRGATLARGGKDVGKVTSAARSPRLGEVVALGFVHREAALEGLELDLAAPAGPLRARVTGLPFVEGATS